MAKVATQADRQICKVRRTAGEFWQACAHCGGRAQANLRSGWPIRALRWMCADKSAGLPPEPIAGNEEKSGHVLERMDGRS